MIQLLVGMIASGKTTFAKARAEEGALIISHDDLTEMLHGEYRYEQELKIHYLAMMRDIALQACLAKRDVVIDRTHLTFASRRFWIEMAAVWDVPIEALVFPSTLPEVHASRRFQSDARGRSYEEWLNVALHHAEQARREPLTEAEGFRRILRVGEGNL